MKNLEFKDMEDILFYNNKNLEALEGEIFKEFPLNCQYLVSNLGRIKSKKQEVRHNYGGIAIKKEKILTQVDNGSGYLSVGLTENGKTKTTRVSRMVAISWIDNPENKPQVNHKKGNKYDNREWMLEWNTAGENVKHAWDNKLSTKQNSFLYIQDRVLKINPYLTYLPKVKTPLGLGKIIIDQSCYRIEYEDGKLENFIKSVRFWKDDLKLILHNLTDLKKEININGEKFVPFEKLGLTEENILDFNVSFCPFWIIKLLYEWHFDIHGLVKKGEAIDINTLS